MDAFQTRENVVLNYREYLSSFLSIADERIKKEVTNSFEENGFILEPLIQFNPSFQGGESLEDLKRTVEIHPNLKKKFRKYKLYKSQIKRYEMKYKQICRIY